MMMMSLMIVCVELAFAVALATIEWSRSDP
jgi:hypothetical protein